MIWNSNLSYNNIKRELPIYKTFSSTSALTGVEFMIFRKLID